MLRKFLVHWDPLMCLRTVTLPIHYLLTSRLEGACGNSWNQNAKGLPTLSANPEEFPEILANPRRFTGSAHLAPVPAGCCGTVVHSPDAGVGTCTDRRYIHNSLPCMDLYASIPLQNELACLRAWKPAVPWSGLFPFHGCLWFLHISTLSHPLSRNLLPLLVFVESFVLPMV